MRIGVFEIDLAFREYLSAAEVLSGRAPFLRFIHLRNVRGNSNDWMRVSAVISGIRARQKAIRNLPVGDDTAAAALENTLLSELVLPETLCPGKHSGELRIVCDSEEKVLPFTLEVLSASWIPTSFAQAEYLASWIPHNDDSLRDFLADTLGDPAGESPFSCLEKIHGALLRRRLMYQPVAATIYPDFQVVSDPGYTLRKGGSCADLSLLLAALLWLRGYSPALLLYGDHITAGCFSASADNIPGILNRSEDILRLLSSRQLCLIEVTDLCSHKGFPFAVSVQNACEQLQRCTVGCCLIAPRSLLRSGRVCAFPDLYREEFLVCPCCGYDHIMPQKSAEQIICPACENIIPVKPEPPADHETPLVSEAVHYDPQSLRYGVTEHGFGVTRCLDTGASSVRIFPVYQNRAVRCISRNAFRNCRLTDIVLPENLTAVEEHAFRGCEQLASVSFPEDLSFIGSGAFSGSGLVSVRIPGSVSRISAFSFSGCSRLKTVTLEEGIRIIDQQAFRHCPLLRHVYLPASVETVSKDAFDPECQLVFASGTTQII